MSGQLVGSGCGPARGAVRLTGAPVAHSEEQRTFNPRVRRSKLRGGTNHSRLNAWFKSVVLARTPTFGDWPTYRLN